MATPQSYAKFLGEELSLVYRGPVLVVMPSGVGYYSARGNSSSAALQAEVQQSSLTSTAIAAIQRLAAAAGHRLSIPAVTARASASSSEIVAWVLFGTGAVVIALAWAASLRARPLSFAGRASHARSDKH